MYDNLINLEDERLLRAFDRIGRTIVDYINDMDLSWEIEMARHIYFGEYIDEEFLKKSSMSYKPFIEWLVFSYKLQSGLSLIECIYENSVNSMDYFERNALNSLKNTYEGLYRVCSIKKDSILVKDVFSSKMVCIWDELLTGYIKTYCGLFMRFTSINNKNIPIPGYSIMTNAKLKETEQFIKERYNEFNEFNSNIPIHVFINSNSLMIHRRFLKLEIN